MCVVTNPSTAISMISTITKIAQSVYGVYKATETIRVNKIQAEQSANAARQSAELARRKAIEESQDAIDEARNKRLQTLRSMAEMKTSIAAGNIDLDSKTALDKIDTISAQGELDALNILDKAEKNKERSLLSAQGYDNQSNLIIEKAKSNNIKTSFGLLGQGLKFANSNISNNNGINLI